MSMDLLRWMSPFLAPTDDFGMSALAPLWGDKGTSGLVVLILSFVGPDAEYEFDQGTARVHHADQRRFGIKFSGVCRAGAGLLLGG